MLRQSSIKRLRFDSLAPNIQVKVPATAAGIAAAEEVTYRGLHLNADRFASPFHRRLPWRKRWNEGSSAEPLKAKQRSF